MNGNQINNLDITSIYKKSNEKIEKASIAGHIKKELVDKVKSYAWQENTTVSDVLEEILDKVFNNYQIDPDALNSYENKYKKKNKK